MIDQASGNDVDNDVDSNIPDQEMVTVDEVGGDIPEHVVDSNIPDQRNGDFGVEHVVDSNVPDTELYANAGDYHQILPMDTLHVMGSKGIANAGGPSADQRNGELPRDYGRAMVWGDCPEGKHVSALRVEVNPNFVNCRNCFSRD